MTTLNRLKQIGAEIRFVDFNNETLIGTISFEVEGVEFMGQFDIDNEGLYAVRVTFGELEELINKLNKN
jgi:hypothetical protein